MPCDLTQALTDWETEAQNSGTCQRSPRVVTPRDVKHGPLQLSAGMLPTTLMPTTLSPGQALKPREARGLSLSHTAL